MTKREADTGSHAPTTGHEWDGIEELNTPLPRWWLWTFYATIVWAFAYWIFYPAWPLISGYTSGALGYTDRGQVAADLAVAAPGARPCNRWRWPTSRKTPLCS